MCGPVWPWKARNGSAEELKVSRSSPRFAEVLMAVRLKFGGRGIIARTRERRRTCVGIEYDATCVEKLEKLEKLGLPKHLKWSFVAGYYQGNP